LTGSNNTPCPNRTICIYFCLESYEDIVYDPIAFRDHVNDMSRRYPEIFPDQFVVPKSPLIGVVDAHQHIESDTSSEFVP
jgi:hypothetical protein